MGVLLGILGGGVPPGSPNPPFFVREFFSRALLCERLEQATLQETTGIPACLPSPPRPCRRPKSIFSNPLKTIRSISLFLYARCLVIAKFFSVLNH